MGVGEQIHRCNSSWLTPGLTKGARLRQVRDGFIPPVRRLIVNCWRRPGNG